MQVRLSAIGFQPSAKIKSNETLARIVSGLKAKGEKIVFTNGCFDIIHAGHVEYLSKARKMGSVLIIGLNSDSSVHRLKGRTRPLNKEDDRAVVLASLGFVDYVTIFDEDTPKRLIEILRPDVLVKGGDWKIKDIVGAGFVRSCGGRIVSLPFVKGYSTTSLIKRFRS
ncbi:MAG: D-glycero-beta-D-manno-heptose 1-phosphate adenylyltransferase [Candidatus Omnitrophota bacterium]|nr:D-glycero-beta-D-manno-heptose 1-phosphate adenylyltransferase [Candidatus Omnitrophota bacterium]